MLEQDNPCRGGFLPRLAALYVQAFHHVGVVTSGRLPARGAGILVSNHISGLDPILYQAMCPRRIVWMMAREYYDVPALRWFYRAIDAIPVARNGRDVPAARAALRKLAAGEIVGLFPEGRISADGTVLPFQSGVAMIALKSGAPVYPAFIDGTSRGLDMLDAILCPQRVYVAIGAPLYLTGSEHGHLTLERATDIIHDAVVSLRRHVPSG